MDSHNREIEAACDVKYHVTHRAELFLIPGTGCYATLLQSAVGIVNVDSGNLAAFGICNRIPAESTIRYSVGAECGPLWLLLSGFP